jgi:hypothetical protein
MISGTLSHRPLLGALTLALLLQAGTAIAGPHGENRPAAAAQNKAAAVTQVPAQAAPKEKAETPKVAAPSAPPKPRAAPAAKCDVAPLSSAIEDLRAELKAFVRGSVTPLSSEQNTQKASYEQELAREQSVRDALAMAVEKGAPKESVAGAIEKSEKRTAELKAKLEEIQPTKNAGLDSVPEQVAAIQRSLQAIEAKLATQPTATLEPAVAAPTLAPDKPAPKEEEARVALGINVDAGLASLYSFRGLNVYKSTSQNDQTAVFNPGVSYSPPQLEGLTVAYWGAFQAAGDNSSQLVRQGIGSEQDFTVSFGRDVVKEKFQARVGVTNYLYPFADKATAGAKVPYYFEPWAQLTYLGHATASFLATYLYGTQDAIRPTSYVYLRPAVEKSFPVSKVVSVVPAVGVGYKIYTHNSELTDNKYDASVDLKFPVTISDLTYVVPAVHYAWSNFSEAASSTEHSVWLSANLGLNL